MVMRINAWAFFRSVFCVVAVLAGSPHGALHAQSRQLEPAASLRPNFPLLKLGAQSGGQAAIDRLGIHLPDVASWYGESAAQLRRQLLNDPTLRVDETGHLLFVEPVMPAAVTAPAGAAAQNIQDGTLAPLEQSFALHSRPGSTRTIYLDFNGATITGTIWNARTATLVAAPFDLDRKPASFSPAELQRIQYIWQRVAEDYAPFDVDVTTEQPSQDRLTRAGVNDTVYGTTVVITKMQGLMSCGCGGIAYVGVFNYPGGVYPPDYYKPAFVFFDMLSGGDEKSVAEAISHEAGHNMGLQHDGTASSAYYDGQGTDPAVGWAPIMGVGYWKPLVQFSKGEYAGANNTEDDFVVAQNFGLPLRLDDHGNSAVTASPFAHAASGGIESGSMDGVIEMAGDHDVFAIPAGPGRLSISAVPANRSANLDIQLTLRDARGATLSTASTLNALGAALSYQLPAQGTYYVDIAGTGQGDPATTGYSSYGSTGNYRLSAIYAQPTGSMPVAVLSVTPASGTAPLAVSFDGRASHDDGRVTAWYWDFGDSTGDQTGALSASVHRYPVPGEYTAKLTVVDDDGLSASTSRAITVVQAGPQASVQSIQMVLKPAKNGATSAVATISVVNQIGQPLPKASVTASWNGIVSKAATAKTGKTGSAMLTSPTTRSAGCFNITVNNIAVPGYSFNAASPRTAQLCR